MDASSLLTRLSAMGVVPVVAVADAADAVPLADALMAGGLPLVEVTFRTAAAEPVLRAIAQERREVCLGAGTVLTREQLVRAHGAGASFAVAPGFNAAVVGLAQELGFPFFPGVATPSEIEQALAMGCACAKFFPAEALGGVGMIKALSGPYAHTGLRLLPTGGVTEENLGGYLKAPMVAAVGGTWIAPAGDLAGGRWDAITARCRRAMDVVASVRRPGA